MVKTYQLAKVGPFGQLLKVAPVTTDSSLNVNTCLQVNGTDSIVITPQSVVPDLSNYKVIVLCNNYIAVALQTNIVFCYSLWVMKLYDKCLLKNGSLPKSMAKKPPNTLCTSFTR